MSLLTFADARPWARAIKRELLAREMPPWFADGAFGEFNNMPKVPQADIDTIVAWVDGGAPEGDGAPPALPALHDGWSPLMKRPPDQVIEGPFEMDVPARGELPNFAVWVKVPFRNDTFVEAMQMLPTNKRVVHHAGILQGNLPPETKLGKGPAWDGGPVFDGVPVFNDGRPYRARPGDDCGYPLLFYVPGGGFQRFPEGIAKRLTANQYLCWDFHFVTTGTPEKTRMRLGLWFAKKTVTHEALTMTVNEKRMVNGREYPRFQAPPIPPGADSWTVTGTLSVPDALTLYSLWPHMHYRGTDMTFILRTPNGREETLLSVPKYDFNWQMIYELVRPLKIPARSTIIAIAHYDNSAKNRRNPAPNQEVLWGNQSSNEMFMPYLEVSVDKNDLRFDDLIRFVR